MKIKYHIPTEEYGFMEIEVESDSEDVSERMMRSYQEITKLRDGGTGLPTKEFNEALDKYLTDGTGETETYLKMNKEQQTVFQEIKKAFKRINK